jgi:hypothetical protein
MSPVVLALDLLLVSLLVLTLILGMRLNGRLKGLKQSHAGFERAVAELNQAAARAEAGLAALRETSAEAHDALLARIDTARALTTRLERANFQAERAAEAVAKAKADLPSLAESRADAAASKALASGDSPVFGTPMPSALATIAALVGDAPRGDVPRPNGPRTDGARTDGPRTDLRAHPLARPGASDGVTPSAGLARRGRSVFDEDLFEGDAVAEDPRAAAAARFSSLRSRPKDDRR